MNLRLWKPAVSAAAAVLCITVVAIPANAAPAMTQTRHFSTTQSWGTPGGNPTNTTNCTGPMANAFINDFVYLNLTGNGVQHMTVNGAGDSWFTTTFTGTGTVTFYSPSNVNVQFDNQGNIVSATVTGPADLAASAKITEWFGFEANNKNSIGHGTIDARGTTIDGALTPAGLAVAFHNNSSFRWAVGANPSGPPTSFVNDITCP